MEVNIRRDALESSYPKSLRKSKGVEFFEELRYLPSGGAVLTLARAIHLPTAPKQYWGYGDGVQLVIMEDGSPAIACWMPRTHENERVFSGAYVPTSPEISELVRSQSCSERIYRNGRYQQVEGLGWIGRCVAIDDMYDDRLQQPIILHKEVFFGLPEIDRAFLAKSSDFVSPELHERPWSYHRFDFNGCVILVLTTHVPLSEDDYWLFYDRDMWWLVNILWPRLPRGMRRSLIVRACQERNLELPEKCIDDMSHELSRLVVDLCKGKIARSILGWIMAALSIPHGASCGDDVTLASSQQLAADLE